MSLTDSYEKLVNDYKQLKRSIETLDSVPSGSKNNLIGQVDNLKTEYENKIHKLEEQIKMLKIPPLQHGVIISPEKDGYLTIGIQGVRFNVALAIDHNEIKEIKPCSEVLINESGRAVVKVLGKYNRGDSAEVLNVLDLLHPPIELPDGKTKNNPDCPSFPKDCKHYKRLHVRGGNNEAIVVETSEYIQMEEINIGDIVRVDTRLAYAFEKLPSFEAGPLLLESDPNVSYDAIGGLDEQVAQIRDAIELPYLHRELFEDYYLPRPKGILLCGPPGCGKTLIAKAIATGLKKSIETYWQKLLTALNQYENLNKNGPTSEISREWEEFCKNKLLNNGTNDINDTKGSMEDFLRRYDVQLEKASTERERIEKYLEDGVRSYFLNVKGPELLDKYVGETEHKIRKIFDEAKKMASINTPVVIFFDEMEAMFQTRGSGISSDIEKTIVPQLLAEMDGVEGMENVIVIGASNREDLIDPAILRDGRLDIKIKIGRPDRDGSHRIFQIYLLPEEQAMGNSKKQETETSNNEDNIGISKDLQYSPLPLSSNGLLNEENYNLPYNQVEDHKRIAEALINETLDIIYSNRNGLHATNKKTGYTKSFPLSDFISGAIINRIVSRAKEIALKRRIAGEDGAITFKDFQRAVDTEFKENAEQMIQSVPDFSKQEFKVDVIISGRISNKWDMQRPRPYQGLYAQ